jgi:protein-tyrosine phosphatase
MFLCTGNFYRSRFSEHLFNSLAEETGLAWRATSRGIRAAEATNVGPLSDLAAYRLAACDVPFDVDRFPMQLTEADLEKADFVVALKRTEHLPMMVERFPDWADRVQYWQVDDIDCATADQSLPGCETCVRQLVETLLADQERQTSLPHKPLLRRRA